MAWSLVGSTSAIITAGAGNQTVTLPGTVASGDLVLVATAADVSCQNCIATAGYTVPENTTGANPGANFGYKVITSDTSVDIVRNATILRAVVVQVWRGGRATILDAAYTTPATGTSANPDSGSITTVSVNALVVTIAFLDDDDSTVSVVPSTFNNLIEGNTGQSSTTVGATVAMASRIQGAAGAVDPAAWTMNSSDAWSASSIAFAVANFGPSLITESVKVTDMKLSAPLEASLTENLKIDDSGQGQTQLVGAIRVSDVVTASLGAGDLDVSISESVKVADTATTLLNPLERTLTESIKVADTPATTLEPLERSLTESIRVTDTVTGAIGLEALLTESVKVSDSLLITLDPLERSISESVRVTDGPVSPDMPGGDLAISLTEHVKVDDIGQGRTQLVGAIKVQDGPIVAVMEQPGTLTASLTESVKVVDANDSWAELSKDESVRVSDQLTVTITPIHATLQENLEVTDSLTAAPLDLQTQVSESVRVSDSASGTLNPLQTVIQESIEVTDALTASSGQLLVSLDENVRVSDALTTLLNPEEASINESVKVSDVVSVTLDPIQATPQESIKVTDSLTALIGLETVRIESIKVSEVLSLTLNPEQAAPTEHVKVSDQVSAQLTLLQVAIQESVKVTDGPAAGTFDLVRLISAENIKVSDSLSVQIDLHPVSIAENVKVSDSVQAFLLDQGTLSTSIQEAVKVSESAQGQLTPLEVGLTESVRVSETTLVILGAGAFLEEPIRVRDTVIAALSHLEVSLTESIEVVDTVDLNPVTSGLVVHVRPRVNTVHVKPRVTIVKVRRR